MPTDQAPREPSPPTAALLLIGDELLSGKIRDENGFFLAKMLRRRGIRLLEVAIVGDDASAIGEALLRVGLRADLVFTSGGVGPTHDDITMASIASAIGRPLQRNATMAASLTEHYGDKITEAALSMADLPEGTVLRGAKGWPVLRIDLGERPSDPCQTRIFVLPGVPSLFRSKLEHLEANDDDLPQGDGWHLCLVHTRVDESKLAPMLDELVAAFPAVEIGSYPRWARGDDGTIDYHVRITLEAPNRQAADANAAQARLEGLLGPEALCEPSQPL